MGKLTKENKKNLENRNYSFGEYVKFYDTKHKAVYGYIIGYNSSFDDEYWVVEDNTEKIHVLQDRELGKVGSNWIEALKAYHKALGVILEKEIGLVGTGDTIPRVAIRNYFYGVGATHLELDYMLENEMIKL